MSALFQINKPADPGVLDRARRDLEAGIAFTLNCPSAHLTYLWEVTSRPTGAVANITSSNAQSTSADFDTPGGYLVKMTVDAGFPTEDVSERYIGIPLPTSGICLPAMNETNQDNSQSPYTGERGFEDKLNSLLAWMDEKINYYSHRRAVIDYINGTLAPPAAGDGDRYILDFTGAPHAGYGPGVQAGDIVTYDVTSATWMAEAPQEGWVVWNDTANADMIYLDDGVPTWELHNVGVRLFEEGTGGVKSTRRRGFTGTDATADYAYAFGWNSVAGALGAVVFGQDNIGSGIYDFVHGCGNTVEGDYGFVYGKDNNVDVLSQEGMETLFIA